MKRSPLKRKKPLARSRKPMKRVKLKTMSSKRRTELQIYMDRRADFLTARPRCEGTRRRCPNAATQVHHKAGRTGGNYLRVATWMAICDKCHRWIHAHPNKARELGLLV